MDKRYQVFVSSTYTDLIEERRTVMQRLLELDCIPAGMELFPAADESVWAVIEAVIKDSDYYVLIIGGRYGSAGQDNPLSYTEREYELAVKLGVPVLAFLHADPGKLIGDRLELNDDARAKLCAFRERVMEGRHVDEWMTSEDLASKVILAMTRAMKTKPRVGWIRADQAQDPQTLKDLERVRRENEELRARLTRTSREPPPNLEQWEFGDAPVPCEYIVERYVNSCEPGMRSSSDHSRRPVLLAFGMTWNEIFKILAPHALIGVEENHLTGVLNTAIGQRVKVSPEQQSFGACNVEVPAEAFNRIKTQLLAMGLWDIEESTQPGQRPSWRLTGYGRDVLIRLLARKAGGATSLAVDTESPRAAQ